MTDAITPDPQAPQDVQAAPEDVQNPAAVDRANAAPQLDEAAEEVDYPTDDAGEAPTGGAA